MGFDGDPKSSNGLADAVGVGDALSAAKLGLIGDNRAQSRSSRKREKAKRMAQASLLGLAFAAEACTTLDSAEDAFTSGSTSGGSTSGGSTSGGSTSGGAVTPGDATTSAQNDQFATTGDSTIDIPVSEILENDSDSAGRSLQVVRVFDAQNGSVSLQNDVVEFTPDDGFSGVAQFTYEVENSDGEITQATVEIEIASDPVPDATTTPVEDPMDDHSGDDHSGHDDGMGDDQSMGHSGDDHGTDDGVSGDDSSMDHSGHDDGMGDDDSSMDHSGHDDGMGDDSSMDHSAHDPHAHDPASDDGAHVHPDDPSKASEHSALMDLVPVSEATHVAVNNGSWFDASTWAGGDVPTSGAKVHIPHGLTVEYDGESNASLFTVRVDGKLEFATDKDTFMEVDTFIVAPSGELEIGTINNPVDANVSAVIQIADNGPIDVDWDPMLLSRGLVSHGEIEIHGAEKTSFLKVQVNAQAGDTSMTLESAPQGWQVGDKLVLTGTEFGDPSRSPAGNPGFNEVETQDEEITITGISGNTIQFSPPLQFDHDTPRDDLKAYVANYSRNVVIQTENADDLPPSQRGHTMFMHSNDVDVRYAEFSELGRTDKSERAFDVSSVNNVESDTNIKSRYPVHVHRVGVDDQDSPAMLVGNTVWGAPGWGMVHHDSHAILADNAVYEAFGSAFVSETGNETGTWSHNIAIKSEGISYSGTHNIPKTEADVDAFDLGRTGAGFWMQSRVVEVVDNVAASTPGGQAFVYFHRMPDEFEIDIDVDTAPQAESLRYIDSQMDRANISLFEGNEALTSNVGLMVVKGNPEQRHDMRSVIEDFTAWEVRAGVLVEYTAHYTFHDLDLVGADSRFETLGVYFSGTSVDMVVEDSTIDGFDIGVRSKDSAAFGAGQFDGDYQRFLIDVTMLNNGQDYKDETGGFTRVLSSDDLVNQALSFESLVADFIAAPENAGSNIELNGVKSDALGDIEVSNAWDTAAYWENSIQGAIDAEGYWTLDDGTYVTAVERYFQDRVTSEVIKESTFISFKTKDYSIGNADYHGQLDLSSDAPNTSNDSATVSRNGSVVIDVLANDSDPDGDPLSVDGFLHPAHGSVSVNSNGTVTYTADPNYVGQDDFTYWAEDDMGNMTSALVTVTVEA
ncbi:MAG: cadherin-like domain-containing protein [Pseudomonadota bacterium]